MDATVCDREGCAEWITEASDGWLRVMFSDEGSRALFESEAFEFCSFKHAREFWQARQRLYREMEASG